MQLSTYFLAFLISTTLSLLLTRAVRDFALTHNLVRGPGARDVHEAPIPRIGGVAIFFSLVTAVAVTKLVQVALGATVAMSLKTALGIGACAGLIFLVGLWDDLFGLSPYVKAAAEVTVAILLYVGGVGVKQLPVLGGHPLGGPVSLVLTILWVLLITNAFNLIDGLDGLAAGAALFSTVVIIICALANAKSPGLVVTVALAGAILGFLRYNFNPASIFLGDSGSLLIGFLLSTLALLQSGKSTTMVAVAIPIVSFGLPVLDVTLAVVRRFLSGKPLFAADNEHIHHKLLKRGLSHRKVVLVLYAFCGLFALTSLILLSPSGKRIALVFVILGVAVSVGLQQLRYHEFAEMGRVLRRTLSQKQIIANNLKIRRAAEALASAGSFAEMAAVFMEALQPIGFSGVRLRAAAKLHVSDMELTPLRRNGAEFELLWGDADPSDCWELKMQLVTTAGERCGTFSILRPPSDERLMMDINMFQHLLQPAVADAWARLTNRLPMKAVSLPILADSALLSGLQPAPPSAD